MGRYHFPNTPDPVFANRAGAEGVGVEVEITGHRHAEPGCLLVAGAPKNPGTNPLEDLVQFQTTFVQCLQQFSRKAPMVATVSTFYRRLPRRSRKEDGVALALVNDKPFILIVSRNNVIRSDGDRPKTLCEPLCGKAPFSACRKTLRYIAAGIKNDDVHPIAGPFHHSQDALNGGQTLRKGLCIQRHQIVFPSIPLGAVAGKVHQPDVAAVQKRFKVSQGPT